jgi:hypothetical protein
MKQKDLKLSLYNYLVNEEYEIDTGLTGLSEEEFDEQIYNFDEVMDYYDNRKEYDFVGIVDFVVDCYDK